MIRFIGKFETLYGDFMITIIDFSFLKKLFIAYFFTTKFPLFTYEIAILQDTGLDSFQQWTMDFITIYDDKSVLSFACLTFREQTAEISGQSRASLGRIAADCS